MSLETVSVPISLEQLLASDDRGRFEIVHGELEEVYMSNFSAFVGLRIASAMLLFCEKHNLGAVLNSEGYYRCFGDDGLNARKPDVSFIRRERLPADWLAQGYFTIPPDLAVEVVSPHDTVYKLDQKIREYLNGGVRLVWIIDPAVQEIMIYRLNGTTQRLRPNVYRSRWKDTLRSVVRKRYLERYQCGIRDDYHRNRNQKWSP